MTTDRLWKILLSKHASEGFGERKSKVVAKFKTLRLSDMIGNSEHRTNVIVMVSP